MEDERALGELEDLPGACLRAPAPWPTECTQGECGYPRTGADRRLRPGHLARWAEGPGAALGAGSRRRQKRLGCVDEPRMSPWCSARSRRAARCALGSGGGCHEARPRPGATHASRSPGPAGPQNVPPPSADRARERRRPWGGALRPREWGLVKASRAGADATHPGQLGDRQATGDANRAGETPRPEGTSADLDFSPLPCPKGSKRPSLVPPSLSGVELNPLAPPNTPCLWSPGMAEASLPAPPTPMPTPNAGSRHPVLQQALAREVEGDGRVLATDISPFSDAKGSIREIILPKGLDLDRPKRTRTSFTAEQLYRLEMEFQRCQYVVGRERTELARQLNLSETQVPGGQACTALHKPAPHPKL